MFSFSQTKIQAEMDSDCLAALPVPTPGPMPQPTIPQRLGSSQCCPACVLVYPEDMLPLLEPPI